MLVLLVEDEADLRGLLHLWLVRHGHDVLLAADGAEALHVLAERAFDVDVVVTDLDMPRLGGCELTSYVRRRAPGVRVIQMTGGAGDHERTAGAPLLLKPFPLRSLLDLLRGA